MQEMEQEIQKVVQKILDVCNGNSFIVNKAALQLIRDHMIREEFALSQNPKEEINASSE
jgi:hypothetical protein